MAKPESSGVPPRHAVQESTAPDISHLRALLSYGRGESRELLVEPLAPGDLAHALAKLWREWLSSGNLWFDFAEGLLAGLGYDLGGPNCYSCGARATCGHPDEQDGCCCDGCCDHGASGEECTPLADFEHGGTTEQAGAWRAGLMWAAACVAAALTPRCDFCDERAVWTTTDDEMLVACDGHANAIDHDGDVVRICADDFSPQERRCGDCAAFMAGKDGRGICDKDRACHPSTVDPDLPPPCWCPGFQPRAADARQRLARELDAAERVYLAACGWAPAPGPWEQSEDVVSADGHVIRVVDSESVL